jgi:hypothetical protein
MYIPGKSKQTAGRKLNRSQSPDARGPHRIGQPHTTDPHEIVKNWNELHTVGIEVIVTKDNKTTFHTKTRSSAWLLGGHTPVIQIKGVAGCYALDRVKEVEP